MISVDARNYLPPNVGQVYGIHGLSPVDCYEGSGPFNSTTFNTCNWGGCHWACTELSLNPSAPTLSTPELTVFARVNLVTVLSSLSRDGIGVPLGSHPPRLLVAFLLLKRRLHTLLYHLRSYCGPRASEIGVWSLTQFDCVDYFHNIRCPGSR